MKKRNILISSLAVFAFGISSVSALEVEEGWTKVDFGKESIAVDKITALKEKLASKVEELNLSSIESNSNELYRYRMEVSEDKEEETYKEVSNEKAFESETEAEEWASKNEPEEEGWSFLQNIIKAFKLDKVLNLTRYEYKAEAETAVQKFNDSLDENCEKITPTEIRDTEGDKTTTTILEEKYDKFDDAQNAANQLLEDNHDYKVVAYAKKTGEELASSKTEPITITEYFQTSESAQAFIQSLKSDGYIVSGNGENGEPEIIKVPAGIKVGELKEEYDSIEEAQTAYNTFVNNIKAQYQEAEFTTEGPITTRNSDKDVVGPLVEGTTEYDEETQVDAEIAKLPENVEGFKRSSEKVTDTIVFGDGENEVTKIFNSLTEVEAYIKELQDQGYDVSKVDKKLVSYEESTWKDESGVVVNPGTSDSTTFYYTHFDVAILETFTEQLSDGSTKTVEGTMTVSSVKITNGTKTTNVQMGSNKVYDNQHESGTPKWEYQSTERNNLQVTNKSYIEIQGNVVTKDGRTLPYTVTGYLSESQNICGANGSMKGYDLVFKSVTIVNNKVLVDSNIINQYKVTGTAVKTDTVWYLDTKTTTLGYDYTNDVEAYIDGYTIVGSKTMNTYKDVYQIEQTTTTKDYDYEVEGTGVKTYYDVISKYVRLTDVEWIIESMNFGIGGDVEVEVLPPQTGVEENSISFHLFILIFCLVKKFI